ncbi:unnamed protein product [Prorocentrum cordatum]|uniref:Uncharacterized protein n=1 Tax=Prorocentrum cordatum TaxID=2364126 RepID=A0ABN9QSB1_9DINO|nr:unnamed protein product [Polarella glacialis]
MAREGGGVALPRRSLGQRKAACDWARRPADRAVVRLSEKLARAKSELDAVVETLDGLLGSAEEAGRVRAILPALTALLEGRSAGWPARLRRNAALHPVAPGVTIDMADASTLRKAQHGPRLESRIGVLSKHAAPFVPGGGYWCGLADVDSSFITWRGAQFCRGAVSGAGVRPYAAVDDSGQVWFTLSTCKAFGSHSASPAILAFPISRSRSRRRKGCLRKSRSRCVA